MTMVLNLNILLLRNKFCSIKSDLYYIQYFEPFNSRLKCLQGLFEAATPLKKNKCADFALVYLCVSNSDDFLVQHQPCVAAVLLDPKYKNKHVLFLVNTSLTGLDMNPNVNPPLRPGQIYLLDGGFSTQLSKYLGAEKVDVESLWKIMIMVITRWTQTHYGLPGV